MKMKMKNKVNDIPAILMLTSLNFQECLLVRSTRRISRFRSQFDEWILVNLLSSFQSTTSIRHDLGLIAHEAVR